ncbi:SRPBCC domain-containing protein [Streptomyces dysideae]|uniref:Carbon monoxide dehydrogenase subunit G n=1 Tax=Streptomyces dysideae TaxID=909626 RepID=A0A101UU40_9ACTN|nr:SRPBCC domain-containing protein [Streptomyces dysideae]KUO16887.1 hypothetical protein AQJ91_33230 [Streptomyces dysideae]
MEHEVFVPVPAERLREVLADPSRVARAIPGLQQDAGAESVAGRMKVRIGGHTITYRGAVRISGQADGAYTVEGDATEARGTGSVKLALTVRARDTDGGSTVTFEGTASADGRVVELPAESVASAVTRLLTRFAEGLGVAATEAPAPEDVSPQAAGDFSPQATRDFESTPDADDAPAPELDVDEPEPESVFDTEVPPPSLDPQSEEPAAPEPAAPEPPVAEAAHARRTMIGRSAEEVDHAPPRGRYAPVPAPQTVAPNPALRWAAPAAAVVVASAIVVGRILRRRR